MEQQQTTSKWVNSTSKAFWGVILISFSGIISTIYDYISYVAEFIEFIPSKLSGMLEDFGGSGIMPSIDMDSLFAIGFSSKGLIIIGYILYLWGLSSFASIQKNDSSIHNVKKVRTATILLIITFLLNIVFGVLSFIPFAGIIFGLITWVMFLICFYMMKHAFSELMIADDFSQRAQRGARNLRYAACCEIRLKWLPLVTGLIVLAVIAICVGMSASSKSFEDIKTITMIGTVLLAGILLFAFIITLFALFCAFWWPIIGWYRIKTGGPAEAINLSEDSTENKEQIKTEELQEETHNLLQEEDSQPNVSKTVESPIATTSSAKGKETKWYYIGGVAGAIIIAAACFLVFRGSSNGKSLFGIQEPQWQKFVMLTAQDVKFYKDASSESPYLRMAMENIESDVCDFQLRWSDEGKKRGYTISDYTLEKNWVLPIIDEQTDWYKVQIDTHWGALMDVYIQKKWTQEVKPAPITKEVLQKIDKEMCRKDYIIESGKLKNLCLTTPPGDMDGELLLMGELLNGCLLFPAGQTAWCYNDQTVDGYTFEKKTEGLNAIYELRYNNKLPDGTIDYEQRVFDPSRLTDTDVERIFNALKVEHVESITAAYYFPEANPDRLFEFKYTPGSNGTNVSLSSSNDEELTVTGYRVYGDEESEYKLIAELGETTEDTGIEEECEIELVDISDYDGNGEMDVIIQTHCGGSAGEEPPYIVYYDKEAEKFRKTERFEKWKNVFVEQHDNRPTIVQRYGIREDSYVFEDLTLKKTGTQSHGVGNLLQTWTRAAIFADDEIEDKNVLFDIDGDGNKEILVLSHNSSNAYGEGAFMCIDNIIWLSGRETGHLGFYTAESYSVLESMSNGMHDILASDAYLFRWNGQKYVEWKWDGKQLVAEE